MGFERLEKAGRMQVASMWLAIWTVEAICAESKGVVQATSDSSVVREWSPFWDVMVKLTGRGGRTDASAYQSTL